MPLFSAARIKLKICLLAYIALLTHSCENQLLTDPFWNIDLRSDISVINNQLYQRSREGKIVDCVFSFDNEFYIKKNELDARVNTSLDIPKVINNQLNVNYTLVPEFRNEYEQQFNEAFFNHFLSLMTNCYGSDFKEKTVNNNISLQWSDNTDINVKVSVIKDINLYMVSIEKGI